MVITPSIDYDVDNPRFRYINGVFYITSNNGWQTRIKKKVNINFIAHEVLSRFKYN